MKKKKEKKKEKQNKTKKKPFSFFNIYYNSPNFCLKIKYYVLLSIKFNIKIKVHYLILFNIYLLPF